MNLNKILDSDFRKGDRVKATLPNGRTIEGTFVEYNTGKREGTATIKPDNEAANSFYWASLDNIINLSKQERESSKQSNYKLRLERLKYDAQTEIEQYESDINRIYGDPELEEWFAEDPSRADRGDLPDWADEKVKEVEKKIKRLQTRIQSYNNKLSKLK